MKKIITISGLALVVVGCGGTAAPKSSAQKPATVSRPTASVIPTAVATPAAATATDAAADPVGIWNAVSTSDPADVYGQYSVTESGGLYILTTETAMKLAGGSPNGCSLPPGTEEGTFPIASTDGNGPAIYEGTDKSWYTNTCGYDDTHTATLGMLSANDMVMTGAITLIRVGSAPTAGAPSAAVSAPATPSSASTLGGPLVGTWTVDYGEPTVVNITESGGIYNIAIAPGGETLPLGGSCDLPAGAKIATFSATATGTDTYSGQQGTWSGSSGVDCSFTAWVKTEVTLSGTPGEYTLSMPSTDPNDPLPVTFHEA